MIIISASSQQTRDSLRAIVSRQMADVLIEYNTDLGDVEACRQAIERANFGRPAISALLETACGLAAQDSVANWKPTQVQEA
ncbi:hypothetical protein BRY73_08415 [Ochrobactrum sp. P6BS-III]|uniref:hypothetical protein n=1 Tax=unclassified Ochrobactrum TaxID=239106 RepID=UPI000991D75F|nr:hypothetical protein [Ochrobactrum sp. P6BSIII]OOL18072.1 hypothetical protein BRY73_08415 [Ochrobactrum sp. P6BS-III]